MKYVVVLFLLVSVLFACNNSKPPVVEETNGLKDAIGDKFYIGTALNVWQISGQNPKVLPLVKKHFNSVVAENSMKSMNIHPKEDEYNWKDADEFVNFGVDNDMFVVGHCLIWHSQLSKWFCADENGDLVSADVLKERMKSHIHTIVTRYKGRVKGWDVVNEAIEDDGSWRKSLFFEILGEEFIELAFRYAHEADPDAELYYNDYNMFMKGKRDRVVEMVKSFKAKGIRIDAIGMQGHIGMDYPDISEFEQSIVDYASTGAKVMITELDLSILPTARWGANITDTVAFKRELNPYTESVPDSVMTEWNTRMRAFFDLFFKHADNITRVTLWGVTDGDSWKNGFPVRGRTDYPLLFDRNYQPKAVVIDLINAK